MAPRVARQARLLAALSEREAGLVTQGGLLRALPSILGLPPLGTARGGAATGTPLRLGRATSMLPNLVTPRAMATPRAGAVGRAACNWPTHAIVEVHSVVVITK